MSTAAFWTRFILAVLATWRVTHLLAREDGPGDLVFKLRRSAGEGFFGRLLDCFHCLSLWVAAPLGLVVTRSPVDLPLTWLALSGAACLLQRFGSGGVVIEPVREDIAAAAGEATRPGAAAADARSTATAPGPPMPDTPVVPDGMRPVEESEVIRWDAADRGAQP